MADQELLQVLGTLTTALDKQSVVLQNIDNFMRNESNESSPTTGYNYSARNYSNLGNATGLLGTIFTNTGGQITQYSEKFTSAIAGIMPSIGGLTAGSKQAADAGIRLTEASSAAAIALRQYGYDTEGLLLQAERQAAAFNLPLDQFVNFISQNANKFALLDGNVSDGIAAIANMKNELQTPEFKEFYDRLRRSGLSIEEINEELLDFAAFNRIDQLQDKQSRRAYYTDLVALREAMVSLADITGMSADEQQRGAEEFLKSAEFLSARLQYGEDDPVVQLAASLGAMGHDTLAKAMVTGYFDPNDPATAMYTSLMPQVTKLAMEAGAMMRAGRGDDINIAEFQEQMALALNREGANLVKQYGAVAGVGNLFDGGLTQLMGKQGFQNMILAQPEDIVKAFEQAGAGDKTALDQILGIEDTLAGFTQDVRQAFTGIENQEVFGNILNLMENAAGGVSIAGDIAQALASRDTIEAESKLQYLIDTLKQQGEEQNKAEIDRLNEQLGAVKIINQMSQGYMSQDEGKKQLSSYLEGLGYNAAAIEDTGIEKLKAAVLNINLEKIQGLPAGAIFDTAFLTSAETANAADGVIDPGYDQDLFDIIKNRLTRKSNGENTSEVRESNTKRRRASELTQAQGDAAQNAQEQNNALRNEISASYKELLKALSEFGILEEFLGSKFEALVQAIRDLSVTYEKGADKQANATYSGALHMAEQAATATLGERVNATVGPIHRGTR